LTGFSCHNGNGADSRTTLLVFLERMDELVGSRQEQEGLQEVRNQVDSAMQDGAKTRRRHCKTRVAVAL